jgi:hypothetical protein
MEDTVSILFAVKQEIDLRKFFQLVLISSGIVLVMVAISSFFGLVLPVGLLSLMLIIYFYTLNKKEIDRLVTKFGKQ